MTRKTKYAIDKELQSFCFRLPRLPRWSAPVLQTSLRMAGRLLLRGRGVDVTPLCLENGVKMYMIKPAQSMTRRAVYMIHGGGFVFPHAPGHIQLAKEYALRADAKVFLIDYRLAPKYPYPASPDDCFMGFQYLYENRERLNIDIENMVIGGDSAGGFLTVTTTLKIHEKYGFVPKGNLLIYPALDTGRNTESMRKYTDTPLCNSRDADLYDEWFNHGKSVSVMHEDLSVMPETYIEVAEFDCLRDCGIAYAKYLEDHGISVQFHDIHAAMHGFDNVINAKITRKCVDNRIAFFHEMLNGAQTRR